MLGKDSQISPKALRHNRLQTFQQRCLKQIDWLDSRSKSPFHVWTTLSFLLLNATSLIHGCICQQKGTEVGEQSSFLFIMIVNSNDHNLAQSHFITKHKHYFRGTDQQLDCIYRNLCCGQWQNFQMSVLSLPSSRKIPEHCSALLAMGRHTEYLIFQDKQWSGLCSKEPNWL